MPLVSPVAKSKSGTSLIFMSFVSYSWILSSCYPPSYWNITELFFFFPWEVTCYCMITASSKALLFNLKRICDSRHESLFQRKPPLLWAMWTTGRHTVNQEKQVAEVDNDLDRILKPKVLVSGSCAKWREVTCGMS